jgi:5-methylthioadenosine/S-adenosylhomocysteine deaminase
MKIAGLLQKHHRGDTRVMPAEEILAMATGAASSLFTGLSGELREGAHADLLLIDPEQPAMTPNYDLTANLVYSATGSVVDTTICAGRVLMEGRRVPGEEEVIAQARGRAARLLEKSGD